MQIDMVNTLYVYSFRSLFIVTIDMNKVCLFIATFIKYTHFDKW